eukprot:4557802-Pleurochrysis_carterae.AAC.1
MRSSESPLIMTSCANVPVPPNEKRLCKFSSLPPRQAMPAKGSLPVQQACEAKRVRIGRARCCDEDRWAHLLQRDQVHVRHESAAANGLLYGNVGAQEKRRHQRAFPPATRATPKSLPMIWYLNVSRCNQIF